MSAFLEECESLQAIYGEDVSLDVPTRTVVVNLPHNCQLTLQMPQSYPLEPPTYSLELSNDPNIFEFLPFALEDTFQISSESGFHEYVASGLDSLFNGEVVAFTWIEWLRPIIEDTHQMAINNIAVQQDESPIEQVPSPVVEPDSMVSGAFQYPEGCPMIYTSSHPIVDRKSVFIGHVASVQSEEQVKKLRQALYSNKKVASAAHNISAYRFTDSKGILRQDYDEDGETAAGGRLLKLLQLAVVKNVFVNVARYFGGTKLGPVRFKHINNAARSTMEEFNFIEQSGGKSRKS